ncbi:MAG: sodium-dependent bicarbonate transport family permease [Myxococcota bacterium]
MSEAALQTLLSPVVLFFALGFVAGLVRSSLSVPEDLAKGLSLYLMLAIGFKGGVELAHAGFDLGMLGAVISGLVAGFGLPLIAFGLLRAMTRVSHVDAAAIAAHYGSISVVTFVAASDYIDALGVEYEGYMVAVVAIMESPAIIAGLILAQRDPAAKRAPRWDADFLREVFLNGSVFLLLGALVIGMATGDKGYDTVAPFITTPFKGVLCLFLLDMGIAAASRLRSASGLDHRLVTFGLIMPVIGATVGLGLSWLAGLSVGSGALLITLCASASYIAVPAAMRVALPQANPAYSLTLSLGVTFPFNLVIGIPLYQRAAEIILA